MFDEADESLFSRVLTNRNHVLQSHLPDRSSSQYNLRKSAHDKELITKTSQLTKEILLYECFIKTVTKLLCAYRGRTYIFYLPLYLVAHVNFLLNEYDDDDDEGAPAVI